MKSNPEFVIFTGPMFGAKSSRLLAALDRAKYQSKKIIAFKPKMDHRYSDGEIVTHSGNKWPAICVSSGDEIVKLANGADIVAVDEAFMIDDCSRALIGLFHSGKTVYVSSIQLSAYGDSFDEMTKLFPWATKIELCPAVCPLCGKDAYYTVAKVDGLSEISVGGADKYEPRCFEHTNFLQ
jgi:thymidine kinase